MTERSTYDDQLDPASFDNEFVSYMESHNLGYDGYFEALMDEGTEFHDAFRYLIYLVEGEKDKIGPLIKRTTGKYLDEIEIPMTDVERQHWEEYAEVSPDELDMEDIELEFPDDKELMFRLYLAYSAEHETDSIFKDLSHEDEAVNEFIYEEAKKLVNPDEYEKWKMAYLDSEYAKLKDCRFLTVSYMFAGIGGYDDVIPEEQFESFICWINGNGSAFFTGKQESTEEEIKLYIAKHAYDDGPSIMAE